MSESAFLADQLRRAFDGNAWHGPSLLELLRGVEAKTAVARPVPDAHTIWELVAPIAAWDYAACVRLAGEKCQPKGTANFPRQPAMATRAAWRKAVADAMRTHAMLIKTVARLPEARLHDRVPGKRYNFGHMLHGVVQHELYHAGQIALLKRAAEASKK